MGASSWVSAMWSKSSRPGALRGLVINTRGVAAVGEHAFHFRIAQDLAQDSIHPRRHPGQAAANIDRRTCVHPFAQDFARSQQFVLYVDASVLVARECQIDALQEALRLPCTDFIEA